MLGLIPSISGKKRKEQRRDDGSWKLIEPIRDMYIQIQDEYDSTHDNLILSFNGKEWIDVQKFNIPIDLHARIRISEFASTSNAGLIDLIKEICRSGRGCSYN